MPASIHGADVSRRIFATGAERPNRMAEPMAMRTAEMFITLTTRRSATRAFYLRRSESAPQDALRGGPRRAKLTSARRAIRNGASLGSSRPRVPEGFASTHLASAMAQAVRRLGEY